MTVTSSVTGLDAAQRTQLERLVTRVRATLEADLGAQAEGRFGIHLNGTIEDQQALPDDPTDRATRRDLVEIINHLLSLGESQSEAVARLLREAAFTHLNRLVAIRIAEAIGLLPESLANGRQSRGFKDLGEIMPILSDEYWGYLLLCGDELAADAPALFDPRNPLLGLAPSTPALEEIVALLGNPDAALLWLAPDTLGWAYQFFNTGDERRSMREGAAAPRTSRELAVRNQFFTPRYVVDFLVQNTLGRRIMESDPASPLLNELPLLVDPPAAPGPPLDLNETTVLDPACGSGHFLLGCYDLLERAWELGGVPPSESAPAIVASLWGVDIDPRCAQLASAAVVLRARRHCRELPLPRPNIMTARSMPAGSPAILADIGLAPGERLLVERISEVLVDAALLGTLLKVEDALEQEIRHAAFGGAQGTLPLTEDAFGRTEAQLMAHLQAIADEASSSVAERLLAAEADDALRFVELVRRRYDVVLMNPPFGEPVPSTKPYLKKTYPWLPSKGSNILTAFVGRGIELCKPGGYVGAITSRVGMFLTTFERWRRDVLLGNRLTALADLGYGVMEQALVEAAAYVVGAGPPEPGHSAVFVRLLKDTDRIGGLADAIAADRAGAADARVFRVAIRDFEAAPGSPLAYWMTPSVRRLFLEHPPVEGHGAEVRVGLQTSDDFRFVRAFWEVDPRRIGRSREETLQGKRWCPFAKGGEYSPYWADIHLVVDWEQDGQRVREHVDRQYPYLNGKVEWVVKNTADYFRAGLTWPRRTNSGFGIRVLPRGSIFADKGPAVLPTTVDAAAWLGVLTSRLVQALLDSMVAAGEEVTSGGESRSYEVGLVQSLPSPEGLADLDALSSGAREVADRVAHRDAFDEVTRRFAAPRLPDSTTVVEAALAELEDIERDHLTVLDRTLELERLLHHAVQLDDAGEEFLDEQVGAHPASYPRAPVDDADRLERLYTTPIAAVIAEVVAAKGGARAIANLTFFADRRLEVLAHAFERHPEELVAVRRAKELMPPGFLRSFAADVLSYLVGLAFGRWDVRIGQDPSLAPVPPELFDPVALCSPGMLVGSDGFPALDAPPGYPLKLPLNGLLVDESGHPWDVESAVRNAAEAVWGRRADNFEELFTILGRSTVRDHLRKQFFKQHLSRYSKSRRRAPIYWPLSVPSKAWGAWIYAPMLSRETLFALASEAARRERLAVDAIARLGREQHEDIPGRPARTIAEELDGEEKLAEELRRFHAEAQRIAELGWEPDLDDGIVLCAAPLADLFPSWPDATKARDELRNGQYEWAGVAHWSGEL